MRCGVSTKRAAPASRSTGYRIENGARALAQLYAEYPRVEPDLKVYVAYVLQRAAGAEPTDRVVRGQAAGRLLATPPRATSCGTARAG